MSIEQTYSCLSSLSNPCDIIYHVFCNQHVYGDVVKSIAKARAAREIGGVYCLYFKNPVDGSTIILKGHRVLEIYENPCKICWCSPTEKCAGLSIIHSDFFATVLLSYHEALQARSESRKYCKSFRIPKDLFPNVSTNNCVTLKGEEIIYLMCKALSKKC